MNGWLNINKPSGLSSAKVVAIIKSHLKAKKVGHGGTLDPLAVGILPICIGNATKETEKMMNFKKEYLFTIKFGETRSTGDQEGEILEKNNFIPTIDDILQKIPDFIGEINQTPPPFSAIKINGQRAYKLARSGQTFTLKTRKVMVYSLKFIAWQTPSDAQFLIECGKGFYVRSFATDFAKSLGCLAYISYLERTALGPFNKSNCQELNDITNQDKINFLQLS
jgi:tRNA pseudouridine55 synthase